MTIRHVSLDFEKGDPAEQCLVPAHVRRLDYHCHAAASRQARLQGRLALEPDVDLADYTMQAVIDWIELGFVTADRHQSLNIGGHINKTLAKTGWREDSHVHGVERKDGYLGQVFLVRVNDPTPEKIRRVCSAIQSFCRLRRRADGRRFVITGIEVAVDIRLALKDPEPEDRVRARWRMSELLRKHLAVRPGFLSTDRDLPRVTFEDAQARRTKKILEPRKEMPGQAPQSLDLRLRLAAQAHGKHVKPPLDGTFYVGADDAPVMLRLQDKTADSHGAGKGRVLLADADRRSRIEVRAWLPRPDEAGLLASRGLAEITGHKTGWRCPLETLEDLRDAKFEALRKPFFDFAIPTVPAVEGTKGLEPDQGQWEVFSRSGVFGLDLYQRRLEKRDLGRKGYGQAFQQLNERMRQALVHLSGSWHGVDLGEACERRAA